jgi:tellurite resistance protein TerA
MSIELRKGQKINLEKGSSAGLGEVLINLNWNQAKLKKGFFAAFSSPQSIDLDLGCLYELADGQKLCVQALGNAFGKLDTPPYIALDGDDRTGSSQEGENLRVNGRMVAKIKRILVYTFIYEGLANWKDADGVVRIKCPGSQEIVVRMDEYSSLDKMCAIAMLENTNNETFSVEKLVCFFPNHAQMDSAYGWGLKWVAGKK